MTGNSPSQPLGPPAPPSAPAQPATEPDPFADALVTLAERLTACEADTAGRFDAMRAAFGELKSKVVRSRTESSITDDPHRRLCNFLGYEPTAEQQIALFTALAAWHATKPRLEENRSTSYTTKKGGQVAFGYADLSQIISVAQLAAPFGLCALTRQEFDDIGNAIVTGYVVHNAGGAISSGPVPLFVGDGDKPGMEHSGGLTTARRSALQMVLGLAAAERESAPSRQSAARTSQPPRRPDSSASLARPPGRPPGWLSRDERLALEAELKEPSITAERHADICERLNAAGATRP